MVRPDFDFQIQWLVRVLRDAKVLLWNDIIAADIVNGSTVNIHIMRLKVIKDFSIFYWKTFLKEVLQYRLEVNTSSCIF